LLTDAACAPAWIVDVFHRVMDQPTPVS
jgi:hypothetical protein